MGVLMSLRWADSREALVGIACVVKTFGFLGSPVFEYIEMFYNRTRRHSHLGGISPEAFEAASNCGF